eukprot:gb/GECG01013240.1/.p1 GENE.gb/GECG01013240.1/~~gb/GECG01013240.1/.p1  ORF type:complete len:178 (+),score=13.84 gb/GECG01013240.1/:1-534(+)
MLKGGVKKFIKQGLNRYPWEGLPCNVLLTDTLLKVRCIRWSMSYRLLGIVVCMFCTGGDSATVNVGSFGVTDTKFTQDHGAGYRQVVDLDSVGKPEQFQRSLFIESLGQSDRIFSAQYDNMLKTWYARISAISVSTLNLVFVLCVIPRRSNNGYFSMILQSSKHSDSEESQILRPSN